jgi:hypothetical protein
MVQLVPLHGGGEYAAAWTRELRTSGRLFTPRTAEYRVWDGAVAAARDAEGTFGTSTGRVVCRFA